MVWHGTESLKRTLNYNSFNYSSEAEATVRFVNGLAEGHKEKRKIKNLRTSDLSICLHPRRKPGGRACWRNWFG